ncbi:MAG: hypothetical protein L6R43_18275 [Planctomycetes bacterium]|nr:hypothetical protein [Planctomycetota bacterium]
MRNFAGWGIAVLFALLAAAAAAPADVEGVPADGKDVVFLADGRVLRCRAGAEAEGRVELGFTGGAVHVPKAAILEIRRFAGWDPAPRDDAERAKAAAGMVRWDGEWIPRARADALLAKDRERAEKLWKESASRSEWENRWKRDTAHFTIEANLPKESVDFYEQALEQYYEYFTSAFKVSVKRRIPVYILRTREEFRAFQKKDTGSAGEHTVGYFVPRKGKEHLVLFDWQGNRAETLSVLFHECTHLLLHLANNEVDLPALLNEGLSEYYGANLMVEGRMVRGGIQDERLADLRSMIEAGTLPSLEVLLAHGHPDMSAGGWKQLSVEDYAHAWAFIHFLMHGAGGKYQPRLAAWMNGHLGLKPGDAAPGTGREYYFMKYTDDRALLLRSLKAKDFDAIEKEFREYVSGLEFAGARGLLARGLRKLYRDRDEAAADGYLGKALEAAGDDAEVLSSIVKAYAAMEGKEEEAERLLRRVLDLDPLNVARRYEMSGWFPSEKAEVPHLLLCEEMAPGDPVALAATAWLAYRGEGRDRWVGGGAARSGIAEAKASVAGGAAVAPEECLRLAGLLLAGGEPETALVAARRAVKGLPGDAEALRVLARAACACGDAAEFARALEGVGAPRGKGAPAGAGPSAGMRVSEALVEAAAQALALDRPREMRKAVDPWFAVPGREPRIEAEWILHLAGPVLTKDWKAFTKRGIAGSAALEGSDRIGFLVLLARSGIRPGEDGE